MLVRITAMELGVRTDIPKVETLARFDAVIRDEIHVSGCVLVRSDRGAYVYPPKGNRKGRVPVSWVRNSEIAEALVERAGSMFEQMSGEPI